jgi:hypothetical protein
MVREGGIGRQNSQCGGGSRIGWGGRKAAMESRRNRIFGNEYRAWFRGIGSMGNGRVELGRIGGFIEDHMLSDEDLVGEGVKAPVPLVVHTIAQEDAPFAAKH